MHKPKRKPQAWRRWRKRALQAEDQLAAITKMLEDKLGMSLSTYILCKNAELALASPRNNVYFTNVEVPVVS